MADTYLVAGGAGFIGSCLVRLIAKTKPNARLVVADALTYAGMRQNLEGVPHDFVEADIADAQRVDEIFAKYSPRFVLNLAAETHVDRSVRGAAEFVRTNATGAHVLASAVRHYGAERLVHVSTDEVYGDLGSGSTDFFTEETPLDPNCPYAAAKAAGDLLVISEFRTHGTPAIITRCTNNYGPRQFPEKLIPFFLFRALAGEQLPVYGDGQNVRDWLFVEDHARGILAALERGRLGEVYNFGGHNEKTNLEITGILLDILGKPKSLISFVEDRLAHDRRYAMDASKAKAELGWEPEHPFEVWIEKTVRWYQQNPKWVEMAAARAADWRKAVYPSAA